MAGWNRSVGCENTALAHRFAIRIRHRGQIAARDFPLQERQSQERRVPLVHVVGADVFVTERLEHRHAAHSQDDFLTETMAGVAVVEGLGQSFAPRARFPSVRCRENRPAPYDRRPRARRSAKRGSPPLYRRSAQRRAAPSVPISLRSAMQPVARSDCRWRPGFGENSLYGARG